MDGKGAWRDNVFIERFLDTTWHAFKFTHFPTLSDDEMAGVLIEWGRRNEVKWEIEEGRTEIGGKIGRIGGFRFLMLP